MSYILSLLYSFVTVLNSQNNIKLETFIMINKGLVGLLLLFTHYVSAEVPSLVKIPAQQIQPLLLSCQ